MKCQSTGISKKNRMLERQKILEFPNREQMNHFLVKNVAGNVNEPVIWSILKRKKNTHNGYWILLICVLLFYFSFCFILSSSKIFWLYKMETLLIGASSMWTIVFPSTSGDICHRNFDFVNLAGWNKCSDRVGLFLSISSIIIGFTVSCARVFQCFFYKLVFVRCKILLFNSFSTWKYR